MLQIVSPAVPFDAIVVGSGATGDWAAKKLTDDGYGDDWPISYGEMVPYYEEVEKYVGISGTAEGLPQLPDSVFLPGMEMTCGEQVLKKAVMEKLGRVVTIGRVAILTRQHNGRAACHYCGPCEQGCTVSLFPISTVPGPPLRTRRRPDALLC